jgi:hypothetical protein
MSENLTKDDQELFIKLIGALQLQNIQILEVHSKRPSIGTAPDPKDGEINISWNQQFADDDPLRHADNIVIFRPKYEVTTTHSGNIYFQAKIIFAVQFSLNNQNDFDQAWCKEQIRKFFYEKQIMKTMWPIVRQQVIDIMSRHSLNPIPLPWLI